MSEEESRSSDNGQNRANAPGPSNGDGRRESSDGSRGAAGSPAARDVEDASPSHRASDSDQGLGKETDGVIQAEIVEQAAEEAQKGVLNVLAQQSFSGPIPQAEDLSQYSPEHQERIFRIAEAFSTDESARRDVMVDSASKAALRAQWISPTLLVVGFAFSLGSYAMYQNVVLSGLFLSIPVLRVIGTTVTSVVRQRRRDDEDDD